MKIFVILWELPKCNRDKWNKQMLLENDANRLVWTCLMQGGHKLPICKITYYLQSAVK